MSILMLMLQTSIAGHHSSRGQTLDREDGFQLLAVSVQEMMPFFGARNDTIVIRGVHDVPTDTSAETRKVEGKLDALLNLVTQLALAVNKNPASVARVGVHDVATDTSSETRKVEGKLDALVNLVTQLALNQKPASFARVCGIRSSNDHHTNVKVHDVAPDTSAETRKVEGKLDALVNLVTQLAVNQKLASVGRVCGIRSSNDHHTNATTAAEARHLIEKMPSHSYQFRSKK
ncbi:hypothetical protein Fmac_024890 [Flemingia macrophylla]|uniref:Uncharacterized protein n=1 Tax=Flemingia macrophylla TaxID=520843 RepID=A0ABD1LQN8_9FABA